MWVLNEDPGSILQCHDCLEVGLFLSSCPDVLGPVGPNSERGDNKDHVQDMASRVRWGSKESSLYATSRKKGSHLGQSLCLLRTQVSNSAAHDAEGRRLARGLWTEVKRGLWR